MKAFAATEDYTTWCVDPEDLVMSGSNIREIYLAHFKDIFSSKIFKRNLGISTIYVCQKVFFGWDFKFEEPSNCRWKKLESPLTYNQIK